MNNIAEQNVSDCAPCIKIPHAFVSPTLRVSASPTLRIPKPLAFRVPLHRPVVCMKVPNPSPLHVS